MISILIPSYNHSVVQLVSELRQEAEGLEIKYEIIVADDNSTDLSISSQNEKIEQYSCRFIRFNKNRGRTFTRNFLAKEAQFEWLLFLDADVLPKDENFIADYLKFVNTGNKIICGGIAYQDEKPPPSQMLRWKFGKEREVIPSERRNQDPFAHLFTANFLIQKKVFEKQQFNEQIRNYGHEDTLFAYDLKNLNYQILHIDNPVYHMGLEENEVFLQKSLISVEGAYFMEQQALIPIGNIRILNFYQKMENLHALPIIFQIGKLFESSIKKNLLGNKPSLKLFDFYRLYHLHLIKNA